MLENILAMLMHARNIYRVLNMLNVNPGIDMLLYHKHASSAKILAVCYMLALF